MTKERAIKRLKETEWNNEVLLKELGKEHTKLAGGMSECLKKIDSVRKAKSATRRKRLELETPIQRETLAEKVIRSGKLEKVVYCENDSKEGLSYSKHIEIKGFDNTHKPIIDIFLFKDGSGFVFFDEKWGSIIKFKEKKEIDHMVVNHFNEKFREIK